MGLLYTWEEEKKRGDGDAVQRMLYTYDEF
jgi:hypothetical protein